MKESSFLITVHYHPITDLLLADLSFEQFIAPYK
jgi:hypothetical protein